VLLSSGLYICRIVSLDCFSRAFAATSTFSLCICIHFNRQGLSTAWGSGKNEIVRLIPSSRLSCFPSPRVLRIVIAPVLLNLSCEKLMQDRFLLFGCCFALCAETCSIPFGIDIKRDFDLRNTARCRWNTI